MRTRGFETVSRREIERRLRRAAALMLAEPTEANLKEAFLEAQQAQFGLADLIFALRVKSASKTRPAN